MIAVEVVAMGFDQGLIGCGDVTEKVKSRMSPIFLA